MTDPDTVRPRAEPSRAASSGARVVRRALRGVALTVALAAAPALVAAGAAASCSYHVERPRLHVTRVDWQGLDTQGVTLRATVAAYNPNDFELPMRDLRATLTIEGVSAPAAVSNLETVLPPRREIPVTVDAMVPWTALPDTVRVALTRPTIAYRLDGSITVDHYITVTTQFAHQGTVNRDDLVRNALPAGLGGLLGGAADLLGQFVTVQTGPPATAPVTAQPDGGGAPASPQSAPGTTPPPTTPPAADAGTSPAAPQARPSRTTR